MPGKKIYHKIFIIAIYLILMLFVISLLESDIFVKQDEEQDYGVFLSLDSSDMERIQGYRTVVIDAQYFSKEDIAYLEKQGSTVYSYINIGSIENFRKYYDNYANLTLGPYENWEEEKWMDVSAYAWQEFLVSLEEDILDKGVNGFFVDNCDVYYEYPTEEIFSGLTVILEHLMGYGKPVIINGGDSYVRKFMERYGNPKRIMTGINQECVWSEINFETGTFSVRTGEEYAYFKDYVETCKGYGLDVYLLEYTTEKKMKQKIKEYCTENQFQCYISDSIELD